MDPKIKKLVDIQRNISSSQRDHWTNSYFHLNEDEIDQHLLRELKILLDREFLPPSQDEIRQTLAELARQFHGDLVAIGRELGSQLIRIDKLEDYTKLAWDPANVRLTEHTPFFEKHLSQHLPFGLLSNFKIEKKQEGQGPNVIFINGFLSHQNDESDIWLNSIHKTKYAHSPIYHLEWESPSKLFLSQSLLQHLLRKATIEDYALAATSITHIVTKSFSGKGLEATLNSLGLFALKELVLFFIGWLDSLTKTQKAGQALSYILQCTDHPEGFVLMGHSLGARVIFHTLTDLAKMHKPLVKEAYLLGGAIGADENWQEIASGVEKIYNIYSQKDGILNIAHRVKILLSQPIGISPIQGLKKITNFNASHIIKDHLTYKEHFYKLLPTT